MVPYSLKWIFLEKTWAIPDINIYNQYSSLELVQTGLTGFRAGTLSTPEDRAHPPVGTGQPDSRTGRQTRRCLRGTLQGHLDRHV